MGTVHGLYALRETRRDELGERAALAARVAVAVLRVAVWLAALLLAAALLPADARGDGALRVALLAPEFFEDSEA